MKLSFKQLIALGFMLFALFLGAGNIIFPPYLGQQAGTNAWKAVLGFLTTGVGLPLLGITAIALTGDFHILANRVGPRFAKIFPIVVYLTIGPFFATPRTGTVTYEVGVSPFLSEQLRTSPIPLLIFTILFFLLTGWLSMTPSKLVNRIGKIITPVLLIVLVILVAKGFITPMGTPWQPIAPFDTQAFSTGFIQGYLTMDTLAALVFGIVVISGIKEMGITDPADITRSCISAGVIAAAGLAFVYISLSFIGATSPDTIGLKDNGAALLSAAAQHLYGPFGSIILALTIFLACITTSVGLVSACSKYFSNLIPKLSYQSLVVVFSLFSMVVANVGLTQLIQLSLPVLTMIYPIAIVLILLSFINKWFGGSSSVYVYALTATGFVSFFDGLKAANIHIASVESLLGYLPLQAHGIGWFVPAIVGAFIGYLFRSKEEKAEEKEAIV